MSFAKQYARTGWFQFTAWAVLFALPLVAYGQSGSQAQQAIAETEPRVAKPAAVPLVNAIQIHVDCSNPAAKVRTIAAGLQLLGNLHPAVLLISGTCHENVVIQGLNGITLQGNPTATIDGGGDPNVDTVEIVGSLNIALNNLTITRGGLGVSCEGVSYCLLTEVTIENSLGFGANVSSTDRLEILDSVIQNNAGPGLRVAGVGAFFGGSIIGNGADGVAMTNGGFFATNSGNLTPTVTIQNNAGNGIRTILHNTISLGSAVITGNAVDGVTLQMGSSMRMFDSDITNNGGHQVRIGDLSIAHFAPGTVTGANYPDVVCDPQFSTTRGFRSLVGTTTNCPAELPPTP